MKVSTVRSNSVRSGKRLYPFNLMNKIGDYFIVTKTKAETLRTPYFTIYGSFEYFKKNTQGRKRMKISIRRQSNGNIHVVRVR